MYIIGGDGSNYVQIYDTINNRYDASYNTMPTSRSDGVCVVDDKKIYTIGGYDISNNKSNKVEVYDTSNNSWGTLANMPTARKGMAAGIVSSDNVTISFSTSGQYGGTVIQSSGAVVDSKKILAIGGEDINGISSVIEIYDISNNSWSTSDQSNAAYSNLIAPQPFTRNNGVAAIDSDG